MVRSMFFWAIATRAKATLHSLFVILERVGANTMFMIYWRVSNIAMKSGVKTE
jgi:hypothetical protein